MNIRAPVNYHCLIFNHNINYKAKLNTGNQSRVSSMYKRFDIFFSMKTIADSDIIVVMKYKVKWGVWRLCNYYRLSSYLVITFTYHNNKVKTNSYIL